MTNFNHFNQTIGKLTPVNPNRCLTNCSTKIVKRLPFGINNKPFGTYYCPCCQAYQFELGKTFPEGGGIYG